MRNLSSLGSDDLIKGWGVPFDDVLFALDIPRDQYKNYIIKQYEKQLRQYYEQGRDEIVFKKLLILKREFQLLDELERSLK